MKISDNTQVLIYTQSLSSDTCDCVWQTAIQLVKKRENVSIFWVSDRRSILSLFTQAEKDFFLRKNRQIQQYAFYKWLPFERFSLVKNINTYLNLFLYSFILNNRKKSLLWIFEPIPFLATMIKVSKWKSLYDCLDNFSVLSDTVKKENEILFQAVCYVFTCNISLNQQISRDHSKVFLVEQGFDEDQFKRQKNENLKNRTCKGQLRFIYTGSISPRIDFKLLLNIIGSHPNDEFIFAGPILKSFHKSSTFDTEITYLLSMKNVQYLGVISREKVIELLKTADVGLIPYDSRRRFNQFSLPLKTLEYFYMGLPVFAMPTPEMKRLGDLVFTFCSLADFNRQKEKLVKTGWSLSNRKRQRAFAISQSWEKKVNHILKIIESEQLLNQ